LWFGNNGLYLCIYSNCFLSASLLGKTALYSLENICLLSSGKVNSTTVRFSSLQRITPIVGFSDASFIEMGFPKSQSLIGILVFVRPARAQTIGCKSRTRHDSRKR